ncbi:MAG: hypothetical protein QXL94_00815 [Candidatus Parvarchaeum sp.]
MNISKSLINKIYEHSAFIQGNIDENIVKKVTQEEAQIKVPDITKPNINPSQELKNMVKTQKNSLAELMGLKGQRVTSTNGGLILPRGMKALTDFNNLKDQVDSFRDKRNNRDKTLDIPDEVEEGKEMIDVECKLYNLPYWYCCYCDSHEVSKYSVKTISLELIHQEHYLIRNHIANFEANDILLYSWCKFCYQKYHTVLDYITEHGTLPPYAIGRTLSPQESSSLIGYRDEALAERFVGMMSETAHVKRLKFILREAHSYDPKELNIGQIKVGKISKNIQEKIKIDAIRPEVFKTNDDQLK